jgi:DNA-binding CsgD family transcriptional regulator/tetratricopeptide (TPR) repeat protein
MWLTERVLAGGLGLMAGSVAFVGRERELSRLGVALREHVRLVLVVGDAGIGKTRFVGEGLARAAARGFVAVTGGCLPLAMKLPLLPVADALGELSRLDGGAVFESTLEVAPDFVRSEVARLLPRSSPPGPAGPVEWWRLERLFAGVAEFLYAIARRSPVGMLIEDVQWADGATLDFLTYLMRTGRAGPVSVVATCRSDELPLDAAVAGWLTQVRRDAGVEEIRLGLLSHGEASDQVTALVGATPPAGLVEQVYVRAEGHPFFTEQLVAAAVTDSEWPAQPVALPARLADLLIARTARCSTDARSVLNALAVAGRPLTEVMLGEITGLDPDKLRAAARELIAARLLTTTEQDGHRPRHALLAEAVAADLLASERVLLHERVARALETAGGETLAAEAAGHWSAAGRTAEELAARLIAANAAEQVFGYADAAAHWQRAIDLCQIVPDEARPVAVDVSQLYIRAVDALQVSGDGGRAGAVAEEGYRRFANHPDRATAAIICLRAARHRGFYSKPAGLSLMKDGLRLFEGTAPSAEHASAWLQYAFDVWLHGEGRHQAEVRVALDRALGIAEAAGAAQLIPRILCLLAFQSFYHGEVDDGFRLLAQARSELVTPRDAWAVLTLAITESDALLKLGRLEDATRVALRGFDHARQVGFASTFYAAVILANAVEGMLGRGRTAEAAALIAPHTAGPIDREQAPVHASRAEIDLLQGEVDAAAERLEQIKLEASPETAREVGQRVAEVAVWGGRPGEALQKVEQILGRLQGTDWAIGCGWLLAVGMRACADLAERALGRQDQPAALHAALAAADNLASWVTREHDVPFTEHPFVTAIPAARATWNAEHSRAVGASDPLEWNVAAEQWEALGYRHRAAYARWRQAEALLATPHGRGIATSVLSTAAAEAVQHVPLMTAIQELARRARIDLSTPAEPLRYDESPAAPFGLTDRELVVLRLLGQGKTNPEIAAALFISPRTAGVHVTHILRKLGASSRVQAATIAEHAGLLSANPAGRSAPPPIPGARHG